jgi:3-hydroxybutyryl-CoA dehydrogenase
MPTASIVGFGTMGSAVAQLFAQKGFQVQANDISENALSAGIDAIKNGRFGLSSLVKANRISEEESKTILSRISVTTHLEESLRGASIVVENVNEDLELKKKVFRDLDQLCAPDVILATDTSSLSITSIASETRHSERVVGMHLFIPPQVMPLVEIINGLATSKDTAEKLTAISNRLGKVVIVSKDRPGFIVARMGLRQFVEACQIVEQGIASVKDVDVGAKKGLGHPMGPFELTDLIGLDTRMDILDSMFLETGDSSWKAPALLRQLVQSGYKGNPALKKGSKGGFYEFFGLTREK